MTGRDLITASLRLIGAVAPGETITAAEAVDGLASLNRMIDSWTNESLMIYESVRESFPLVPGVQLYTMGPGGDFNTIRPTIIDQALLRVQSTTPAIEYPIMLFSESEWANIRVKETQSNLPGYLYYETTYPLLTLNIYTNPSAANFIVLYSRKPLTNIATLDTVISLPPGYEDALVYNQAIRLAPEYGRQPSEIIFNIANESKAALKRVNHKASYLRVDEALLNDSRFNIYTGGPR